MKEDKVTEKVKTYLDSFPKDQLWYLKVSDRYTSGIPDIIGNYRGLFFAIELKASGETPRLLQEYTIKTMNKIQYCAVYADTLEQVKSFIAILNRRANSGPKRKPQTKSQHI